MGHYIQEKKNKKDNMSKKISQISPTNGELLSEKPRNALSTQRKGRNSSELK